MDYFRHRRYRSSGLCDHLRHGTFQHRGPHRRQRIVAFWLLPGAGYDWYGCRGPPAHRSVLDAELRVEYGYHGGGVHAEDLYLVSEGDGRYSGDTSQQPVNDLGGDSQALR